ncbi:mycothiol system anti-sigma-R factor [Actinokineospora globicatena]|uniref:mycothiol system anti-sigma-R factor n=1 Tax=Actinokineospora globicatena TaxID=103729 RepID=UPI0020A46075|nr:mycothiol system anti-sigma-R factor [Actinokineospora globicatena]MCP2302139.1 mycothiol system anti-sigma-R factor [Actinokineospora globicatena]GLW76199.1 mycothiol system anti-sigma-R factor [Actinokineospora globicatena]GLW83035.1 mycothiol system anti-sigma-R factor [Actinokineospora globicatena]
MSGQEKEPCADVLSEVWLFLDSECDLDRRQALQTHLDECVPCLEQYGLSEHLKVLLGRKCGGDQVSHEFRERVRASIRRTVIQHRGAQVEITSTRVELGQVEQRGD